MGMLRASSRAVGQSIDAVAAVEGGSTHMPLGRELVAFVDAVVDRDPARSAAARSALASAGGGTAVADAAAVLANFEMMTRVADGTGARQLPERLATLGDERARLGLDHYESAR